ncbi:hypothetical protein TKK_0007085 [Trichogramma kaykai]
MKPMRGLRYRVVENIEKKASGDANDNTLASSSSSSVEVIVTPRNIDSNNNEVDGSSSGCDSFRQRSIFEVIDALIRRSANITTHKADVIRGIAEAILREDQTSSVDACVWLDQVFPSATTPYPRRRCYSRRQRKKISKRRASYEWRKRRREYAKIQELFGSKMSAAAKLVLDGPIRSVFPSMEEMVSFWEPILTTPSKELDGVTAVENRDLQWIADPVSMRELLACEVPLSSAPGPDSITSRQWRSIPISLRAFFLNVILAIGGFPSDRLLSRTIFIPKKDGSSLPSEFHPISVSSVVVRHLHKVFASRLMRANLVDERQRGMHDGCAENITVLSTILSDAKSSLKELHVVSLDVAKAFDSVSHHAITSTLKRLGLPSAFVRYIEDTYRNSSTVLTIKRSKSEPIRVTRGVRQGDPLSSLLFSLVVDRVLTSLPSSVGYHLGEHKIDALAYADDIVLFSSSILGMKEMLRTAGDEASKYGLQFNAAKCIAMSILIASKPKTYKVSTAESFQIGGGPIRQLGPTEHFRYLGVHFSPLGIRKPGGTLVRELANIASAPLKPQQRLKILRCFLVPRFYHQLVLSRCHLQTLKSLDRQVRAAVRKWLRLPKDVPIGYFHARCLDGGLGIPSFRTAIPALVHSRLSDMAESSCAAVRGVFCHRSVQASIRWAETALSFHGRPLIDQEARGKYWASLLHQANDGKELSECARVRASHSWVDRNSAALSGRDYVHFHHVRVNALPTRVRTSRGRRVVGGPPIECRAGCGTTETAAHVVTYNLTPGALVGYVCLFGLWIRSARPGST